ncbi:hypothetical protein [Paraburkholderia tropica]|uniref:hypothetical protein n=1 Tax=Paraburkholderia tropica TaxID=92647 RepID=UPI001F4354DE|nr:hypothetical protein [Paraburkholderia tropica]
MNKMTDASAVKDFMLNASTHQRINASTHQHINWEGRWIVRTSGIGAFKPSMQCRRDMHLKMQPTFIQW